MTGPALHRLFERQAAVRPHSIALVCDRQLWTYQQLNDRANQLAAHLAARGVGRESLVGVCVQRTPALITALLAVLKAGGAYVPLDPVNPPGRIRFMIDDAALHLIITDSACAPHLADAPARLVNLDTAHDEIGSCGTDNPQRTVGPQDLAYVIYTSGSTGTPKGVMVPHANVVRLFTATAEWFSFTADDVWTLFHSYAFDFSVWELWGALLHGGRLVIVPYTVSRSPRQFYTLLGREQVTVLNQTPSAFRQLCAVDQTMGVRRLDSLRTVIFGGEALDFASLAPWFARYGDTRPRLVNMYGITETTVHVTYRPLRAGDCDGAAGSLIGVPIPDLQLHLLDEQLQPVPDGTPGEIHVGGPGVARGYLNRPDLTAARFVPDPFTADAAARLYRSGDLAVRQTDGELAYLGRKDQQVQLRGFRIEPGEIEATLERHPAVNQAVVVLRPDPAGAGRLVAYLQPTAEPQPSVAALREHLADTLADYMIPAAYVWVADFPLTANGKLDQRALPDPDHQRPDLGIAYVAPQTDTEQALARIWSAVLDVSPVGRDDDFFALGGDSLSATRVLVRVQQELGRNVSLASLFAAPTIAGLAAAMADETAATALPPPDRATDTGFDLSSDQQRLLFFDRLVPDSAVYTIAQAVRLEGRLDVAALQAAFARVLARHEIVRAVIRNNRHLVQDGCAPTLELVDCLPDDVDDVVCRAARQPFDLATGPLLRCQLLRVAARSHVLLVCMHHIIGDAWSLGLLLREVGQAYTDPQASLCPLPRQYRDYVGWQRHLQPARRDRLVSHWQRQLAGMPPLLSLPTDFQRPATQRYTGQTIPFEISAQLTAELGQLARANGATLFMVLLAGFQVLLMRYSDQADIAVGAPVANRPHPDFERLIGFFVNTLVLRTDLSGNPSFSDLLTRVRHVVLDAFAHQEMPFEQLVRVLAPERSLSHAPLFQVLFAYHNVPRARLALPGVTATCVPVDTGTAKFDLTVNIWPEADRLAASIEYSTDLFAPDTIASMTQHFQVLLQAAVAAPGTAIEQLPLLSRSACDQLIHGWNRTRCSVPLQGGLPGLIERQLQRTPDRVAVVCDDDHCTCRTLAQRSTQLAHYLRQRGVGPDTCVAVSLERSVDLMVALVGIMKAGGAYVPLDPDYPRERLAYMLEDAGARLLVTQSAVAAHLPCAGVEPICLDRDWSQIAGAAPAAAPVCLTPDNLAYVIYTSGSTGTPKGVQVPHGAVVNFLCSMAQQPGIDEQDRLLAVTTCSFDIHVLELYLPLVTGARLIIAPTGDTVDGRRLAALVARRRITMLQATPSTWRLLIEAGWQGGTLRTALCGGEPFPRDLLQSLCARGCAVWNMYGPTETTVWSTCQQLRDPHGPITIGRPIANTRVYVLDRHQQPVPVGVSGELYIGGAGVTRGYRNRPELTTRQFVPDPFDPDPDARLYRTGDRVRYRANGTLEYLERMDYQVKVRGFRVEPGEIETVLKQHPLISQAVAVVREDVPGDVRIVAYYVPDGNHPVDGADLLTLLRGKLPAYMLPQHLVALDALPLTPAGKIDRKQLPPPEQLPAAAGLLVEARTPMELQIAAIWQRVLRRERIDVHANFFDLGGHSLLAVRVMTAISTQLGREFPLEALFRAPTIAGLAQLAQQPDTRPPRHSMLFPIQPRGDRPPLFICAGAHDNDDDFLRYVSNLIPSLGADQPVYGFRPERLLGSNGDRLSVEQLAAHYLRELEAFQPGGPYLLLAECVGGIVAYEMAQQLHRRGQPPAMLVMLDTECPTPEMLNTYRRAYHRTRLEGIIRRIRPTPGRSPLTIARDLYAQLVLRRGMRTIRQSAAGCLSGHHKKLGHLYRCILLRYRPQPYAGPLTLIINQEDYPDQTTLGWEQVGIGQLDIHRVPGNHVTRMTTHRNVIGSRIRDCIERARIDLPHS